MIETYAFELNMPNKYLNKKKHVQTNNRKNFRIFDKKECVHNSQQMAYYEHFVKSMNESQGLECLMFIICV